MSEELTKRCSGCKQFKPLSEFDKSRNQKDGHHNQCKICKKHYRNTITGKIAIRKGVGKYRNSEKGKTTRKRYRQSEKGKSVQQAGIKHFKALYPNQCRATSAVNHAIRDCKLPRSDTLLCHYCPKPAQQYHHWHGYEPEHWLDVVPVCKGCHIKKKRASKRYEVQYTDGEGIQRVMGWADDPKNLIEAVELHPSFHSPKIIDRQKKKQSTNIGL